MGNQYCGEARGANRCFLGHRVFWRHLFGWHVLGSGRFFVIRLDWIFKIFRGGGGLVKYPDLWDFLSFLKQRVCPKWNSNYSLFQIADLLSYTSLGIIPNWLAQAPALVTPFVDNTNIPMTWPEVDLTELYNRPSTACNATVWGGGAYRN